MDRQFGRKAIGAIYSAIIAASVAGCSTTHEFRVDAVGDSSAQQTAGAASAVPGYLVVGGNILLGSPAQRVASSTGPALPGQSGYVSTLYLTTGQSLIQLDSGTQVLVGALGGLDSPVSLDPASGQVLGLASSALDPITIGNPMSLSGAGPASQGSLLPGPSLRGPGRATGIPSSAGLGSMPGSILPVGTSDPLGGLCC